LKTPGIEVNEVFRLTGGDVASSSNGRQRPAVYNQFYGIAYLGSRPTTPAATVQPAPTRPVTPPTIITETIHVESLGQLTYSLSNSLDEIERAIFTRTGKNVRLDNVSWRLNTNVLHQNVKALMNRHNVNYSMTIDEWGPIINKRVGTEWYVFRP
jgi:hypothetical protein